MADPHEQVPAAVQEALDGWNSADPQGREALLGTLRRVLIARGRWNEPAAAAAHGLLDLATSPETADRHHLLVLVADVLAGDHTTRLSSGLDLQVEENQIALEQDPAARIHSAAAERLTALLSCLESEEPAVRAAGALVLSFIPACRSECEQALARRLGVEEQALVRAGLVLALGLCSHTSQSQETSDILSSLSTDDGDPVVLGAAELVRLWNLREEDGGADLDRLAVFIQATPLDPDLFPWHRGQTDRLVDAWAFQAGGWAAALGARALARAVVLPVKDPQRIPGWVQMALGLLFDPARTVVEAAGLTPGQRDLVIDLSHGDVGDPGFSAHGIPHRAVDRRRWLGLAPPGPLDLEVELEPPLAGHQGRQPLWRVIGALQREPGTTDEAVLDRLSGRVAPEKLLEALAETCDFAYLLRPFQLPAMARAVDDAGSKAAAWARAQADALLAADQPHPERSDLAQVALYGIVHCLKPGEVLEPRYEELIEWQAPFARQVLAALDPDRLEALFVRTLDSIPPQAYTEHLDLILPLVDLCPTDAVARRVIHLTSEQTLGRWILDGSAPKWFAHFQSLLAELSADRPDLDEALERARSTALGRRS